MSQNSAHAGVESVPVQGVISECEVVISNAGTAPETAKSDNSEMTEGSLQNEAEGEGSVRQYRPRVERNQQSDDIFFAHLSSGNSVTRACEAAGYVRQVAYAWKAKDRKFGERWEASKSQAYELVEEAIQRRCIEGINQPVFYKGQVVGNKTLFSDKLMMLWLRYNRPHRFTK